MNKPLHHRAAYGGTAALRLARSRACNRNLRRAWLLLLSIAPALAAAAPGQSRLIQPDENAFAMINAAAPGDVFLISPGTYNGGTIRCSGVTIRRNGEGKVAFRGAVALHADGVVLEGLTWEDLNGTILEISGRSNVVLRCEFREFGRKQTSKAIWIRETGDHPGNRVEECLFEDWGNTKFHNSCVKIGQQHAPDSCRGTIIRGNTFRRGAVGGNDPAIQPFSPSVIENNTIHDCEDGIETKGSNMIIRSNVVFRCLGGEAMSNRAGSSNLFEANLLYDCPMYAWQIWTGHGNVWRNNVVVDCGQIAIIKGGEIPEQIAADDLLINNTFVNNRRGITWDLKKNPPRGIRFINNLFVGTGSAAIEVRGQGFYQEDYNLYAGYRPPTPLGAHSLTGKTPLFTDLERKDFRLRPGSAGIDAGFGASPDVPAFDKQGTPRPQGRGVDIGAYELRERNAGTDLGPAGGRP